MVSNPPSLPLFDLRYFIILSFFILSCFTLWLCNVLFSSIDIRRPLLLSLQFNCCGVFGTHDFLNSTWYKQTKDYEGLYVPTTCCVLEDSENPVARNFDICQVEALVYGKNEMPLTEVHVTVSRQTSNRLIYTN